MILRVGLENNVEGRSLAWALEHPGLFTYGVNGNEALANLPAAALAYAGWIARHAGGLPFEPLGLEMHLEETWECFSVNESFERVPADDPSSYEVNAWFLHDWQPLTPADSERGQTLLAWSRADLLEAVTGLDESVLSVQLPGERWSIAGVLGHVGGAEWWYLDRLGLALPQAGLPREPFQRLAAARARLVEVLPGLAGAHRVLGVDGEFWSPRKLLRRAIWHERDHVEHIQKLIRRLQG